MTSEKLVKAMEKLEASRLQGTEKRFKIKTFGGWRLEDVYEHDVDPDNLFHTAKDITKAETRRAGNNTNHTDEFFI